MSKDSIKRTQNRAFASIADALTFVRNAMETASLADLYEQAVIFIAKSTDADFIAVVDAANGFESVAAFGTMNEDGTPVVDAGNKNHLALIKALAQSAIENGKVFSNLDAGDSILKHFQKSGMTGAAAVNISYADEFKGALVAISRDDRFVADEIEPLFCELSKILDECAKRTTAAQMESYLKTAGVQDISAESVQTRGEMEKRFKDTESRLASIFSHLPYVVLYETGGGREYISQNIYEWLGYSSEELTEDRKNFGDLMHPDDRPFLKGKLADWHAAGEPGMLSLWFRVKRVDGEYRWVEDRMVSVKPPDAPKYMTGVMLDITEKKNAEIELENSRRFLKNVIDASPTMIVVRDEFGEILLSNTRFAEAYGLLPEDVVGLKHYKLWQMRGWDAETIDRWSEEDRRVCNDGVGIDYVEHVPLKNNLLRYWRTIKTRLVLANGRRCVVATYEDVTEKVSNETALRESEERYRMLFERGKIGICLVKLNPKGVPAETIDINDECLRIIGYSREEMIGTNPLDIFEPGTFDSSVLHDLIVDNKSLEMDQSFVRKDGSMMTAEISTHLLEIKGEYYALAFLRDKTEKSVIEKALRESEERFRLLVETMPDGMGLQDVNGLSVYVNDAYCTMFGYTREELIGHSPTEFMSEENARIFEKQTAGRAISDSTPYEIIRKHKDGHDVCVRVSPAAMFDANGKFRGSFAVLTDITKQKENELALKDSEERWRSLVEYAPVTVSTLAKDGTILSINRGDWRTPSEIVGSSVYASLDADTQEYFRNYLELVFKTGGAYVFETSVRNNGNENSWLEHRLGPIYRDAEIVSAVCITTDITGRKLLESATKRSAELLSSIRDSQALFIAEGDKTHVFESLLNVLIELTDSEYGFLHELDRDPDGTPYLKSLAISDIAWDEGSRKLYEKLLARNLEFRNMKGLLGAPVIHKDTVIANTVPGHPNSTGLPNGHPKIENYMGIPLYYGDELIGTVGVANRKGGYSKSIAHFIEPFTSTCAGIIHAVKQKAKEKELYTSLAESEIRFRSIFENSAVAMLLVGLDSYFMHSNDAACKLLGYTQDEITSLNIAAITHPDEIEASNLRIRNLFHDGHGSFQLKKRYMKKDGTVIWGNVNAALVNKPDGTPWMTIAQITDITSEVDAKNAQELLIDQLTKALGEIRTLRGMIPICASCKKIRDDSGYWQQIESYLHEHSDAEFSHSLCPECAKKLYPDYFSHEE